jgi:hypothetical protein
MICFNTKFWPLVYFYIDDNGMNQDDFEEYKKTYLKILVKCKKEKTKIILISDLNNQNKLELKYVMKQAYFNLKIEKFNKLYVRIVCVYLTDKSFKKILNMYFNICKPYCPYKICVSYDLINKFIKETTNEEHDTHIFKNLIHDISNLNENEKNYKEIKNDLKDEISMSK